MQRVLRQWPDSATGKLCGEWCYPANDVDDYRQAVKALVEAAQNLINHTDGNTVRVEAVEQAIAAVERLEVE